jgi:arylamine N-acetyltransferase
MSSIKEIESLMLKEFESIPFHNLFMLNNKNIAGSSVGGTCSDKVLHFRKILSKNGYKSKLHSAIINDKDCHRMLSIEINNKLYFIDVGSGWPIIKLIPAYEPTKFSVFGMTFKTELYAEKIILYHRTNQEFKIMCVIPLIEKKEEEILRDIENRFDDKSIYPFQSSLRFSKIIGEKFYFLKGNRLRIYHQNSMTEKTLTLTEISQLIKTTMNFDLTNLEIDFK